MKRAVFGLALGSVCATQVISPEKQVSAWPFAKRLLEKKEQMKDDKRYLGLDLHKHYVMIGGVNGQADYRYIIYPR
jgi:hypothetical protein